MKLNNMQFRPLLIAIVMFINFSAFAQDKVLESNQVSANQMQTND